jgi:hypothetical protein
MGNIPKKEGALTPGTSIDPKTLDASLTKLIKEISIKKWNV